MPKVKALMQASYYELKQAKVHLASIDELWQLHV